MESKGNWGVRLMSGLLYLNGRLPLRYHRWWAGFLSWLVRRVFRYRTDVVMANVARSFPEKKYAELKDICRRFYHHFALIFTEMFWFAGCRGEKGRRRLLKTGIVTLTNPEEWNRLYRGAGQLVVLHSHMGNWELMGGIRQYFSPVQPEMDPECVVVTYLPLSNSFWDKVTARIRVSPVEDQPFDGYIPADGILRYAISHRDQKRCYIFNTDQYPYYRGGAMSVTFMNQPTRSMTGPAALACKLDAAICYLRFLRKPDGNFTMTAVPLAEHAGDCNPEDIMTQYYKLLEEDLKEQPWNYLWTHKRWK